MMMVAMAPVNVHRQPNELDEQRRDGTECEDDCERGSEETRGVAATRGDVLDNVGPTQLISAHHSDLHRPGSLEARE